jgi:predicted TIM-barrel fold metal-dependent hydrolase
MDLLNLHDASRRRFLAAGAAATAAALLPASRFARAAEGPAARVLVDWHSHYVSRAEVEYLATRATAPRVLRGTDGGTLLQNADTASAAAGEPGAFTPSNIATRLAQLDASGIQRQLLTHTVAMGFDATLPVEDLRPLYRRFNDELAGVLAAHPGRFLAVAALPTADPGWAATELRRAHRELGFIGGSLPLNAFATLRSAQTQRPLFDEAQRQGSHLFIHRASASASLPDQPPVVIPQDAGFARWPLINNAHLAAGGATLAFTDFLAPYPDVSVEIVMLAGFLPYLVDTWVTAGRAAGIADPLARLRRLYFDTGPYATRSGEWVALAVRKIGADRILFGTDYGVGGGDNGAIAPALATLDAVLTPAERRALYIDNSRTLLARLGKEKTS